MRASDTSFIEDLVASEIRFHVAKARGRILSASACVDEVLKVYPTCGLSRRHIEDMVIVRAARASVVVDMDEAAPRRRAMEVMVAPGGAPAKPLRRSLRQGAGLPAIVHERVAHGTLGVIETHRAQPWGRKILIPTPFAK